MATAKDELARALEALAAGQADADHEQDQRDQAPLPEQVQHVSHSIRPLPGKPGVPAAEKRPAPMANRSIYLRQTIIPPLLTLGVLMPLAGITSLIMGVESPLGDQLLLPIVLILLGLLIVGAAALNMLHVRHLLSATAKR